MKQIINKKMKNMLFESDLLSVVKTVYTVEYGHHTYYVDLLKSGEYGVSVADQTLEKFNTIEEAKFFIKEKL